MTEPLGHDDLIWDQAERLAKVGRWIWDARTQACVYCSAGLADIFGMTPEDFIAQANNKYGLLDAVHPDDRDRYAATVVGFAAPRTPGQDLTDRMELEYRIIRPDGQERHLHEAAFAVFEDDGTPVSSSGAIQDITETRLAQRELEHARAELEARVEERTRDLMSQNALLELAESVARIGHWKWSDNGETLITCSKQAAKIFGLTVEQFFEVARDYASFLELVVPEDRETIDRQIQAFYEDVRAHPESAKPLEIEYRIRRPDGEVRYILERASANLNPGIESVRTPGTVQDITERKLMEIELKQANDGLEEKVAERTEELEEEIKVRRLAQQQADQANRAKSDFLSSMSHELRTPLNAVIGFSEALQMGIARDDPAKQEELLQVIAEAGRQLDQLIGEVLDFAKIEQGGFEFTPEPLSPDDIWQSCLPIIEKTAGDKNLEIRQVADTGATILADGVRLRQILLNLLTNAVKYNTSGGSIDYGSEETEQGNIRIFVRDSGLGIAPEDVDRIFQPFDRLRHSSTDIAGTGIGLSISKKLTEAMGGKIGFESEPGEGSTFWIEFPTLKETKQGAAQ